MYSTGPTQSLLAACLKAKILAEKGQHMILEAIRHFAGVSARKNFEAVCDSIFVENIVQLAGIET